MMGHWQKQTELWVEPINLGRRIPRDHLLRKINKVLDLGFVRREVAGFYGSNGHVSVDPVIIIKLMLLLFLDDVRSERELMRIVPLRLDYLWFLGYGLEDEIPTHSVLSKARKRWGAQVFERLFARSVEQCVAAGLVDGSKLYLDASLVAANASRNSVIEVVVRREVSKLEEQEPEEDQDSGSSGGSVNRKLRSTTDPDSTVVRHQQGKPTPSYKNHRALDDKAGVVTAITTTTGAIDEASELIELIERHERVTAAKTKVAVADSRYGNTANLIALAQREIRAACGRSAQQTAQCAQPRNLSVRTFCLSDRNGLTTGARRERSFTGTTLLPGAATMNIGRSGEPARAAGCESSGRVIRTDAPSSATRARSFWIRRASNPIPRKRALTASAGNGFKSATSPRQPFSTALSELAGADCGDKAFRIT